MVAKPKHLTAYTNFWTDRKTRNQAGNLGAMTDKTGILLINLGTPEATGFWPVRRYLKEFLSDKRVIEASGPVWWLILNGIILNKRPKSSGHAYQKIWNNDLNESPLKTITRAQAVGVADHFASDTQIVVDWAMRYGQPEIGTAINRLMAQGCRRILFFPLYPQYSGATTASAMDGVFDAMKMIRHQPEFRSVVPYYSNPAYISALARSVALHQETLNWTPDVTLASFHGLPESFIENGDPYQSHCEATVELLRAELGVSQNELLLSYQSRSGRAVWIGPDTEETLAGLARSGTGNVLVLSPGFAADCVETLEEIEIRAAEVFSANGGLNFSFVPCLNDSVASISMLTWIIEQHLSGWHQSCIDT